MAGSSQDSGFVDNWQAEKTGTECNLHMLTTEDFSDVIFRVGSEKYVVRAHRYVLVSRSCVFHAMFCGPLAEKGEVAIPDIEHEVFREFLQFLYTDVVNITIQNVTGLLYTARKYAVDILLNKCATFLENSLSEENVCQILERCHDYGEVDLEQRALKILTEADEKVTKSKGFKELCSDCLDKFLRSDDLKLKEESVFEAVLSWIKHQCLKESVALNHKNICKFLGDKKYEIRFQSMPVDYIATVVGPSDVLSDSERLRIIDSKYRPNTDISPFRTKQRKHQTPVKHVHRFRYVSLDWCSTFGEHELPFSCDKAIQLAGCRLLGPDDFEEGDYSIAIQLFVRKVCIASKLFQVDHLKLHGERMLNDIMFHETVQLDPNVTYKLSMNIVGPDMSSGHADEIRSSCVDGVTFRFKSLRTGGFIYGLIFRGPFHP